MVADRDDEAAKASEPLYAWWLSAIEGLLDYSELAGTSAPS
jgi:hypothetical protein